MLFMFNCFNGFFVKEASYLINKDNKQLILGNVGHSGRSDFRHYCLGKTPAGSLVAQLG